MDDTEEQRTGKYYNPHKQFIGSIVPNWLMKRTDVSQGAKLCFGRLAQFAGKHDFAFPGHQRLAVELGVSVATVKSYLRELAIKGLIESQRMGSANFSRYYFLHNSAVEFRTDGRKTIHHALTDGENYGNADGQKTNPSYIEENQEENHQENQKKNKTHHSDEWRSSYSFEELEAIDLYNEICVPRGWRRVNACSEELQKALGVFLDGSGSSGELKTLFETAADERDAGCIAYNTKLGNKMLRILWENY